LTVSIILPCRNEEESLKSCIELIKDILYQHNIKGEIIVSDSSIDNSPQIARDQGVVLHKHDKSGYGTALLEGLYAAQGKYLFFADPDGSYDFREIPRFLNYLEEGYDFVIGDRFTGKIDAGAMPWSHRYIGNPLLSAIFRAFYRASIRDVHCGMRALPRRVLAKLDLRTTGMEFASEMVMKAVQHDLKIKELSINYHQRKGRSKLRTFADGWRHLSFMISTQQ